MPETLILTTKLYMPAPPPHAVIRPRLLAHLDAGLPGKLTLVSAPAGFGKTTAVSAWAAACGRPVAWLSLNAADSAPTRFLTYLIAALQTVDRQLGHGLLGPLQSPQPPSSEAVVTALLNELAGREEPLVLVLDDYHVLDSEQIDQAVAFLLEHLPPGVHLVIATREDPRLPLARLRASGQLSELRAAELRFSEAEAAELLNDMLGLHLAPQVVAALEARTEGWVAGLQLAAISLRGHGDPAEFIAAFTGSHRFVLDYLVEEVLHQQPADVQEFLLRTAILERFCGPLCDAVLGTPAGSGNAMLAYLEQANLFVIPLDNERRWFRYHHLFAELLRQRLQQQRGPHGPDAELRALHTRASLWFEAEGLEIEAFQHAAAAGDLARAEALIMAQGRPLYVRGGLEPIRQWLESLPPQQLATHPSLSVIFAMVLTIAGQMTQVETHLQAAEAALDNAGSEAAANDLTGRIASIRALLALLAADPQQIDTLIEQSQRALEFLHPNSLSERGSNLWKLGLAYQWRQERVAARQAYLEAIDACERSGNIHTNCLATTSLGHMQHFANQLHAAEGSYRRVLELLGEPPGPVGCEAHLGLGRLAYEWNDLGAAWEHGRQSVALARQIEISNIVSSEVFLAQLQLHGGDAASALAALATTEQMARQRNFWFRLPEIASVQVLALLQLGDGTAAGELAQRYDLPMSRARVHLAEGNPAAALGVLGPLRQHTAAEGWQGDHLRVLVLEAIAQQALGAHAAAQAALAGALALGEPVGCLRVFLDEGAPMLRLLAAAQAAGVRPAYVGRLLATADAAPSNGATALPAQPLVEPLSRRELEVLQLIAQGRSNREIGERLFLALDTVKGHNRAIFGKLQVQRRTEAVARARELGLI